MINNIKNIEIIGIYPMNNIIMNEILKIIIYNTVINIDNIGIFPMNNILY